MTDRTNERRANAALGERECAEGRLTLESRPQIVDLGLTNKCNLDCVMCFSRSMPLVDMGPVALEREPGTSNGTVTAAVPLGARAE